MGVCMLAPACQLTDLTDHCHTYACFS